MRRVAPLLLFALPLFAEVYEIHSSRYLLAVERTGEHYDVSVTDLEAKTVIASERVMRPQAQVSVTADASGDRKLRVRLHEQKGRLDAELRVERENLVLEVLQAKWLIAPYTTVSTGSAPLRVGGDVRAPVLAKRVEPQYTEEARTARITGIVIIEAIIDRTGRVTDAKVLKPLPFGLDAKAVEAVRQWEFDPATLNGEPVDVIFNLVVSFKLERSH